MEGTIRDAKAFGYSDKQAELLGQMDDLFEEAQKLELCTGDEAIDIGKHVGLVFGKHTGKL